MSNLRFISFGRTGRGWPRVSMNASIDCWRLHFGHCFSRRTMSPRIAEAPEHALFPPLLARMVGNMPPSKRRLL